VPDISRIIRLLLLFSHSFPRDTVSSVGISRNKSLPGTTSLDHVCFFRHALALDELRVKFLPEYAAGGVMLHEGEQYILPRANPHIKEVWFSGTHSDM
jgi:uncharacterized protein (DUF2235 family)